MITILIDTENIPAKATIGSACIDLAANEEATITRGVMTTINTGIKMKIPEGYMLQIYSRSGLAAKHGIIVANAPGIIDSDYVGDIKVILTNLTNTPYLIRKGDRIAQAAIQQTIPITFMDAAMPLTHRGNKGLGSTGK